MLTQQRLITILLLTAATLGRTLAQDAPTVGPAAPPMVAAAVTGSGVRFTASGPVVQMRLEVFSPEGEKVFDSGESS